MVQDYNGATVVDTAGERIGTIERSYVDDTGTVRMVEVKIGRLRTKHRLVPVDDARPANDEVKVPYTKQMIEDSPDAGADDTLEGETLERVRAYYGGARRRVQDQAEDDRRGQDQADDDRAAVPRKRTVQQSETADQDVREAEAPDASSGTWEEARAVGRVRDLGDTIEIPIVEEEIVKRPVVKEVLRVKKSTIVEQQRVSEDLRREDVEIDREGDVDVRVDDQRRS